MLPPFFPSFMKRKKIEKSTIIKADRGILQHITTRYDTGRRVQICLESTNNGSALRYRMIPVVIFPMEIWYNRGVVGWDETSSGIAIARHLSLEEHGQALVTPLGRPSKWTTFVDLLDKIVIAYLPDRCIISAQLKRSVPEPMLPFADILIYWRWLTISAKVLVCLSFCWWKRGRSVHACHASYPESFLKEPLPLDCCC